MLCLASVSRAEEINKPIASEIEDAVFAAWLTAYSSKQPQLQALLQSAGHQRDVGYLNSLVLEPSPYLLRHAVNPVNWQVWKAGLTRAEKTNRLIFLSVGYSTCHWCHVMEKESFFDEELASLLNRHFVSIKVDRELSPQIDGYFSQLQALVKGSGGWPITAVLTPDGKPVWIDAYLPTDTLQQHLERLSSLWQKKPGRLQQVAKNLLAQTSELGARQTQEMPWQSDLPQRSFATWRNSMDQTFGGFSGAPKFPEENFLLLTLSQYQHFPDNALERQIKLTLDNLRYGGLRDHIHGGFYRYASDGAWLVPHFEKMLYNQALLISVFSRASRVFSSPEYLAVAEDILAFSDDFLRASEGGYYSAIDADYMGKEGRYYLFSNKELADVPPAVRNDFEWRESVEQGQNLALAKKGQEPSHSARAALAAIKLSQPLPHVDEKLLLGWNALMVNALADLYNASGKRIYLDEAIRLAEHIEQNFVRNGGFARAVYQGEFSGDAQFEDYSYLTQACLTLFQYTRESRWLSLAFKHYLNAQDSYVSLPGGLLHKDSELPSALAIFVENGRRLKAWGQPVREPWQQSRDKLRQLFAVESGRGFYAAMVLSDKQETLSRNRVFAQGHGGVSLQKMPNGLQLAFDIAPGWHINSHRPNQPSLIATEVYLNGRKLNGVEFPPGVEKKLGFDSRPLSLFEGRFSVTLPDPGAGQLVLKLQACSNELCLLPETLNFFLGASD